ncbi:DUF924 family protein [Xylophilus rhododendri]|uniref:DUF924 family protein n=1 Tax=Xylophilus rhododendri TaxID=2697032 RepID=A0A857J8C4_9BURK|nr:DUF924 family protein [Xylophilus rhododendri]QHJ00215.1 DUF924 family protein [Xylophilus rhododendri]
MHDSHAPSSIVAFWRDAGPQKWFKKDEAFDAAFRQAFFDSHLLAARQQLGHWMDSAEGALGLLLLLDQYPRNAFRDTAHMFATDALARHYARLSLARGWDRQVDTALRPFFYLPFEHSEDATHQALAVRLCESLDAQTLRFARLHADIIERFGRFPHRNAVLMRQSTEAEQAFLDQGGFAG